MLNIVSFDLVQYPKAKVYKTAWSPLYKQFVTIKKVLQRGNVYYFFCDVDGQEIQFSEFELEQFCFET